MITLADCTPQELIFAQALYRCYCDNSDNRNWQGLPCPAWGDLPATIQSHWGAVARLAMNASLQLVRNTACAAWLAARGFEDLGGQVSHRVAIVGFAAWFRRTFHEDVEPENEPEKTT